jgi:hypothetical protein
MERCSPTPFNTFVCLRRKRKIHDDAMRENNWKKIEADPAVS